MRQILFILRFFRLMHETKSLVHLKSKPAEPNLIGREQLKEKFLRNIVKKNFEVFSMTHHFRLNRKWG